MKGNKINNVQIAGLLVFGIFAAATGIITLWHIVGDIKFIPAIFLFAIIAVTGLVVSLDASRRKKVEDKDTVIIIEDDSDAQPPVIGQRLIFKVYTLIPLCDWHDDTPLHPRRTCELKEGRVDELSVSKRYVAITDTACQKEWYEWRKVEVVEWLNGELD